MGNKFLCDCNRNENEKFEVVSHKEDEKSRVKASKGKNYEEGVQEIEADERIYVVEELAAAVNKFDDKMCENEIFDDEEGNLQ